eukprot:PhM_4_TR10201/c0_g1_i1/m.40890
MVKLRVVLTAAVVGAFALLVFLSVGPKESATSEKLLREIKKKYQQDSSVVPVVPPTSTTLSSLSSSSSPPLLGQQSVETLVVSESRVLSVVLGNGTRHVLSSLTSKGVMASMVPSPPSKPLRRVVIEVGTNINPEFAALRADAETFVVLFEPMPKYYAAMTEAVRGTTSDDDHHNVLTVPAAIAPTQQFLTLHESSVPGCSSLLPMSGSASTAFLSTYQQKLRERKTSKKKVHGTARYRGAAACAQGVQGHRVPVFPLADFLRFVPPSSELLVDVVLIDAQGFDLSVAKSLGVEGRSRVAHIILECQNLPRNSTMLLTVGAGTCGMQYNCLSRRWGWRARACWLNSAASSEYNCVYSNPEYAGDRRSLLHEFNLGRLFPAAAAGQQYDPAALFHFDDKAPEC